jgi:hypothetical protein
LSPITRPVDTIDPRCELVKLTALITWEVFEQEWAWLSFVESEPLEISRRARSSARRRRMAMLAGQLSSVEGRVLPERYVKLPMQGVFGLPMSTDSGHENGRFRHP